jgi:gliding motility-associated-like protein
LSYRYLYILTFIAGLLASMQGFGQTGNNDGCVNLIRLRLIDGSTPEPILDNTSIICAGNTVRASSCTGQAADYNMGQDPTNTGTRRDSIATYESPGIYTIRQLTTQSGQNIPLPTERKLYVMPNTSPNITISYCEGRRIQVTIQDTDPANFTIQNAAGDTTYTQFYNRYIVNFGNGESRIVNSRDISFIYEYAAANTYTITVQGLYPGTNCGGTYTETIRTGRPILAPDLQQVRVPEQNPGVNRLSATVSTLNYLSYQVSIRYGNGAWQAIDTIASQPGVDTEEILRNLEIPVAANADVPCIKVTALNPCEAGLDSKIICASTLTAQTNATEGTNTITWSPYPGPEFASYELYRDGNLVQNIPQINTTGFTDTDVLCGVNYCYQLVVKLSSSTGQNEALQSISDTVCVTTQSTRPPQALAAPGSTVTNSRITVSWQAPVVPVGEYRIFRDGVFVGTTRSTEYADPVARPDTRSYCYIISFTDICGNMSEQSTTTCTIWLKGEPGTEDTYALEWTAYQGETSDIQYIIEYLDAQNQVYKTEEAGTALTFNDPADDTNPQIIRYRIKAVASTGETLSYSNVIERRLQPRLFFPEAFSPNGDGQNDLFRPYGAYIESFELVVYNRWGEIVYTYRGAFPGEGEGWDGTTHGGRPAPIGMYQYTATAVDAVGSRKQTQGRIMLVR